MKANYFDNSNFLDRIKTQGWHFAQTVRCSHGHIEMCYTNWNFPGLVWHEDCSGAWSLERAELRPITAYELKIF